MLKKHEFRTLAPVVIGLVALAGIFHNCGTIQDNSVRLASTTPSPSASAGTRVSISVSTCYQGHSECKTTVTYNSQQYFVGTRTSAACTTLLTSLWQDPRGNVTLTAAVSIYQEAVPRLIPDWQNQPIDVVQLSDCTL